MTGQQADIQWYIAREGKQHGPLSDVEMRTFVAQGHLKPTDLIWRPGFADWRPAPAVFPFQQPEPPAAARARARRRKDGAPSRREGRHPRRAPRGRSTRSSRIVSALRKDLMTAASRGHGAPWVRRVCWR